MGYCMDQGETKFHVKAENKAKARQAVRALLKETRKMGGGSSFGGVETRSFCWVDMDAFRDAKTLDAQLMEWRWEAEVDAATGDIVDLCFRGEKLGDDEVLFEAIAPFVESGSFIQMSGEDGHGWRWCFDDGRLCKKSPTW